MSLGRTEQMSFRGTNCSDNWGEKRTCKIDRHKQWRDQMTIKHAKSAKRSYDPQQDLRRFIDGVRMHPFVSATLDLGAGHFSPHGRPPLFDKRVFFRAGIRHLANQFVISRIEPAVHVPDWVPSAYRKLALRGGRIPIWLPTTKMERYDLLEMWNGIRIVDYCDDEVLLAGDFTPEQDGSLQ